jgi:HEAT repeat protein
MLKTGGILLLAAFVAGAQTPAEKAVAALRAAARGGDEEAITAAADRVVALGAEAAAALVTGFERLGAAESLWSVRVAKVMKARIDDAALAALALHGAAEVRAEVQSYACAVVGKDAFPLHVAALSDPDVVVRRRALDGLCERPELAAPHLTKVLELLRSDDFWLVGRSIDLFVSAAPEGGPAADAFLRDSEAIYLRLSAPGAERLLQFLAGRYAGRAGKHVVRLLERAKGAHAVPAIQAASELRLQDAAPRLRELSRDREPSVAIAAIKALGMLADTGAVSGLIDILQRAESPEHVDACLVSLRRITGQLIGADVAAWRKVARDLDI